MARLETVPVEELEAALEGADGRKEVTRLLVAIIYKRGPSVPMIAEWLDVREQTIYRWFDRLEEEPIDRAVRDRQRPGRPPKLDASDREAFRRAVRDPPSEAGFDRPAWTTELARRFLEDALGVEYSRRHVRRLLKDAGLRRQTRQRPAEAADRDERTEFWEPVDR
ncbi:helix-turn-helix domain-containing protein [Halosimplex amylolyticum]|uniref:helix-turn-helix domain-containing protein n=1 Tax=Halosimplex amylolyticum TaxID=3396616 RepID=UPI003F55E7B3